MKILFCAHCEDVFRLQHNLEKCACGSSSGKLDNEDQSVYSGAYAFTMDIPIENLKGLISFFKDKSVKKISKKEIAQEDIDFCVAVLTYLNDKAGTDFSNKFPSANCTLILQTRRENDATLDDFKKVIDKCIVKWKGTSFEMYLRPSTLFGKTNFVNYLGELSHVRTEQEQPAPKGQFGKFVDSVREAKGQVSPTGNAGH